MQKKLLAAALLMGITTPLAAQIKTDSSKVFTLGEVVAYAHQEDSASTISMEQIRQFHRLNVSAALHLLPGISQSNMGPRNESMIYLRGFDLRQTPVFMDGIPVYVPYDGYVDLARFTTFHLSKIIVEKGGASVLYGPNTMGGVINLLSSRPVHALDINASAGWLTGGHEEAVNIGSRMKKFYLQADLSGYQRDYYNLPDGFTATKTEDGGKRNNSYNNDWRYGVKLGFTPNEKNELAIGFSHQEGTKGTPVYTGTDTLNSLYKSPRFWQWPKWNKESIYFLSNSALGAKSNLKTRLYFDRFINVLKSFDDATYTTQKKPYAFTSYYNDYTFGGNVEYGYTLSAANSLRSAVHFKQDVHREHNEGEPERKVADNTFSAGITDRHTFDEHWALEGGAAFNYRQSVEAQNYNSQTKTITDFPSNNSHALNAQAKLAYAFAAGRALTFSVDRMTRFATIKDRYSYRLGTAIPNPDLKPENTLNFGLQYNDTRLRNISLDGSIFYNRIRDVIQNVNNVSYDTTRKQWLSQSQNKGRAAYYGAEAAVTWHIATTFTAGANYTYIKRKNLDNPKLHFTDVPEHKAAAWLQYNISRVGFLLNGEYNTNRYSTSYGTVAPSFFLLNASAVINVVSWLKVQGGVNNIFDKNYMLTEGYPEQGRNYFVKVLFNYSYF
ncbi:iron complex outermembrane recepter protein [Chitinophaga ginsengisegetis]|uniref:Iron complex outermembrane recepter protein n=1 Tax=Chitinophaga ginsengisegetis TaxID=393003 RepID=A0A1T5NGR3_9BACT|nr:TonB-dependent receptor plug domain-containing protein [Chitinophaga ginsengisegetis]SKC99741.1 iron complex outermembrane recepter protein [Chitinophaga ginsengisegetis]